jgi:hypothetical protein
METEIIHEKVIEKVIEKGFDTVKTFRKIKESISKDIWGLSYEELMQYLENSKHGTVRI